MIHVRLEAIPQKLRELINGDVRRRAQEHPKSLTFPTVPRHLHAGVFGGPVLPYCFLEGGVPFIGEGGLCPLALGARRIL
jgi:hypothetical protein